ncbi:TPA: hypothetical protein N0F65_004486 [Lagenidium giganteum]|uniref:Ankyrin repeat protein n=1 Tax=Lagenidium giganteum TaxID=4803 RepID=A0AAV2ZJQ7_9STRA|nr:TPA: hypothetical protein N0F65_004486 [Lagenidium giganteum]
MATALIQVLGNATLLRLIVTFSDGLPMGVVALEHAKDLANTRDHEWLQSPRTADIGRAVRLVLQHRRLPLLQALFRLHQLEPPRYEQVHIVSFERAFADAIDCGDVAALTWLQETTSLPCPSNALEIAVRAGHADVVEWLGRHYPHLSVITSPEMMDWAAGNGHLSVVQLLHDRGAYCSRAAMDNASADGHLAVLEWMHRHRREGCTSAAMDKAAANGHLKVVQWLHQYQRASGCTHVAMDGAAAHGHLEVVQWLHQHRTEGCTPRAMDKAAGHGHLAVVEFLHHNRREGCTTAAMDNACSNGHLDAVRFLHEHRTEGCTHQALVLAARKGHGHVVQFLVEHRVEGCLCDAVRAVDQRIQETERQTTSAVVFEHELPHLEIKKFLRSYCSVVVSACFEQLHKPRAKRRRCQRKRPSKT